MFPAGARGPQRTPRRARALGRVPAIRRPGDPR